jgi:hypothetical protein
MSTQTTFLGRLIAVLVPTKAQILGSLAASMFLLAAVQSGQLLRLVGISDFAISATRSQLHERFAGLLASPIASSAALVTFWASIGLIAYLICWGAYNVIIEARNEVTIQTQYTNQGHWRGPFETLGLKAVGAVALISALALLKTGLPLWLALAAPLLSTPSTLFLLWYLSLLPPGIAAKTFTHSYYPATIHSLMLICPEGGIVVPATSMPGAM